MPAPLCFCHRVLGRLLRERTRLSKRLNRFRHLLDTIEDSLFDLDIEQQDLENDVNPDLTPAQREFRLINLIRARVLKQQHISRVRGWIRDEGTRLRAQRFAIIAYRSVTLRDRASSRRATAAPE